MVGVLTVRVTARVPVALLASVAVTVKEKLPPAVGVPVSWPPLDRLMPAGRLPTVTAYVYGPVPPLAVKVWLYAVPIAALGGVVGVMVMVTGAAGVTLLDAAEAAPVPAELAAVTVNI